MCRISHQPRRFHLPLSHEAESIVCLRAISIKKASLRLLTSSSLNVSTTAEGKQVSCRPGCKTLIATLLQRSKDRPRTFAPLIPKTYMNKLRLTIQQRMRSTCLNRACTRETCDFVGRQSPLPVMGIACSKMSPSHLYHSAGCTYPVFWISGLGSGGSLTAPESGMTLLTRFGILRPGRRRTISRK